MSMPIAVQVYSVRNEAAADLYDTLKKIKEMMCQEGLTTQGLKHLTSAIKDIKDIKGIKSDIDLKEQNARIDKLRKEIEGEKKDTNITITFGDEVKKYGV